MARQYRVRPSELAGVTDEFPAYCFDRAVYLFGTTVEEEVEKATDGKKKEVASHIAQNVVALWTGGPLKFASPTATR